MKEEYEELNSKYQKVKKSGEEVEALIEKTKSLELHLDESNKEIEKLKE